MAPTTRTRTYGDRCGVARGLDAIGERWGLLVVRELVLGPRRFKDLQAGLPAASPNVLSQRLRELVDAGVVRRAELPPPAGSKVYELTEWGEGLRPVIDALGRWGATTPMPPTGDMSVVSHLLAMGVVFRPDLADDFEGTVELDIEGERFIATVGDGEFVVRRGEDPEATATIELDRAALRSLLWDGVTPAAAERDGRVVIEGDRRELKRFLGFFPRPQPASLAAT